MMNPWRRLVSSIAVIAACGGRLPCETPRVPQGKGIAAGQVRALTASPKGDALAWLEGCSSGDLTQSRCDVRVYSRGTIESIGRAAPLQGGLTWSPDGRLAVLVDYDGREGELRTWSDVDGVEHVADAVTSFSLSNGRLAYVSRGLGFWSEPGMPTRMVRLAKALSSISAAPVNLPGGTAALALAADDELFAVRSNGVTTSISRHVAEYEFSPTGEFAIVVTTRAAGRELRIKRLADDGPPSTVARGVTLHRASSGNLLAFVADRETGPELNVADLVTGKVRTLARAPERFEWASDAPVLAWIAGAKRSLGVVRPGEGAVTIADEVTAFVLSRDGSLVAYTRAVSEPRAYNQLNVARVERGATPIEIEYNVPAFAFTPDAATLVFSKWCDSGLCTVSSVRAPFGNAHREFQKLDGLAHWFKVDQRTGRVLTAGTRNQLLAQWKYRDYYIDADVDLESVIFLPPDSDRVAYVVTEQSRAGVYIADLSGGPDRE